MEWQEETIQHLRNHVGPMLPAKGMDIIESCNKMEDVPEQDREVISNRLSTDKEYETLDDVLADINSEE